MSLAPLVADGKVLVGVVRRRTRRPRLRRGVRCRDRQGAVADLHGSGAGRAGQRDLAEGRSVEDRRRLGLGHRRLRSGDQPGVLGHRQRRPVDGRPASGRQPLHLVDDRARRRDRQDQGPLTSTTRTIRGTGTRCRRRSSSTTSATAGRSRAWSTSRATAISGSSSARRTRSISSTASRSSSRTSSPASIRRPAGRSSPRNTSRAPARRRISARGSGAARTGRRSRTARRPGCSTSRPTRTCAASSSAVTVTYVAGQAYTGVTSWMYIRQGADHIGEVQAWNVDTGKKVWTHNFGMSQNWGPMLATGGGLVFAGGTNDRKFRAFDATVRQAAVGVPDAIRRHRRPIVVQRRRQAVHRRAVRLGRRRGAHAGAPEPAAARRLSGGAAGRLGLGVRGRLGCLASGCASIAVARSRRAQCTSCLSASRRACVARCACTLMAGLIALADGHRARVRRGGRTGFPLGPVRL